MTPPVLKPDAGQNKSANAALVAQQEALRRIYRQQSIEGAKRWIKNLAVMGLGGGAAMAAGEHLLGMANEPVASKTPVRRAMPIRLYPPPSKRKPQEEPGAKAAGVSDWARDVANANYATHPAHNWWMWPAGGAALFGGGMLGYGLSEAGLRKLRQKSMQYEIDRAKKDYEEALQGPPPGKLASERSELAQSFDKICSVLEKHAEAGIPDMYPHSSRNEAANIGGIGTGIYALMALGLLGGGLYGGFRKQRESSQTRAIQRAQRERVNSMSRERPVELLATVK